MDQYWNRVYDLLLSGEEEMINLGARLALERDDCLSHLPSLWYTNNMFSHSMPEHLTRAYVKNGIVIFIYRGDLICRDEKGINKMIECRKQIQRGIERIEL